MFKHQEATFASSDGSLVLEQISNWSPAREGIGIVMQDFVNVLSIFDQGHEIILDMLLRANLQHGMHLLRKRGIPVPFEAVVNHELVCPRPNPKGPQVNGLCPMAMVGQLGWGRFCIWQMIHSYSHKLEG